MIDPSVAARCRHRIVVALVSRTAANMLSDEAYFRSNGAGSRAGVGTGEQRPHSKEICLELLQSGYEFHNIRK